MLSSEFIYNSNISGKIETIVPECNSNISTDNPNYTGDNLQFSKWLTGYSVYLNNEFTQEITELNTEYNILAQNTVNFNNDNLNNIFNTITGKTDMYKRAQINLFDYYVIFPSAYYTTSDLSVCKLTYNCSQITGIILSSGLQELNEYWNQTVMGVVSGPYNIYNIQDIINANNLSQLYTPYVTGTLVKKQPVFINEQLRFTTAINGWQDYYVILSGGVINNDNIEVIKITSSTIDEIKNVIFTKYNDIDDINTYRITGDIELIPTPIICGYMSGITETETKTIDINVQNRCRIQFKFTKLLL